MIYDSQGDFTVERFDAVVRATRELAIPSERHTEQGVQMFDTPSLALHMGGMLTRIIQQKKGQCLRRKDLNGKHDAMAFEELYAVE